MMLGPFPRPVHLHGMPTVGQLPITAGDLSAASSMHDLLSDSDLSLKDMMGVHDHDSMFQAMDDSLSSGSMSTDIFADAMKGMRDACIGAALVRAGGDGSRSYD